MRWIYSITFDTGKSATCPSKERVYDCLPAFRQKFGDSVVSVTERYGNGKPVDSRLLPLSREEANSVVYADRIKAAIDKFHKRK